MSTDHTMSEAERYALAAALERVHDMATIAGMIRSGQDIDTMATYLGCTTDEMRALVNRYHRNRAS